MAPVVAGPQLFHPLLVPLFSGLAKIQASVLNAPFRESMAKINAAYYASFEESRIGDPAYIASDIKAMGNAGNHQIVKAMASYGQLFKVIAVDSTGAKNLAKAAAAGVGFLSADA